MEFVATPYDTSKPSFFFETIEEMQEKSKQFGIEEFEIEPLDNSELFKACGIDINNLETFINFVDSNDEMEQAKLFFLCDNFRYSFEEALDKIDDVIISSDSALDCAMELFEEIFTVPQEIACYIDYDAYLRDLELNGVFCSFEFNGTDYVCLNADSI